MKNTIRGSIIGTLTSAALVAFTPYGSVLTATETDPCAPYMQRLDNISGRHSEAVIELANLRGELITTTDNLTLARAQSEQLATALDTERATVARLRARIDAIRARR